MKTIGDQGYKFSFVSGSVRPISAPAGTPKEIVDILASAVKRAISDEEYKKMEEAAMSPHFMRPAELESMWTEMEAEVKLHMFLAK